MLLVFRRRVKTVLWETNYFSWTMDSQCLKHWKWIRTNMLLLGKYELFSTNWRSSDTSVSQWVTVFSVVPHALKRAPWPVCMCLDSFAPWQWSQGTFWRAKIVREKGKLQEQEHTSVIFVCLSPSSMCYYLQVYRLVLITVIKYFCHHISFKECLKDRLCNRESQ